MRSIPLFLLLAACVGCASFGKPIDQSKLATIKKGETTKAQVIERLGQPQNIKQMDGPEGKQIVFDYVYIYARAKGESFIPVAGAFMGGAKTTTQSATIAFDSNDVVASIATSVGADEMKSGVIADTPANTNRPPPVATGRGQGAR